MPCPDNLGTVGSNPTRSAPRPRRGALSERTSVSESKGWFCYILECADQSYYIGVATDLEDRIHEHNSGQGARHTRLRKPVRLVWSQLCPSYAQARALEAWLKGWTREKKSELVRGSLRLGSSLAQGE